MDYSSRWLGTIHPFWEIYMIGSATKSHEEGKTQGHHHCMPWEPSNNRKTGPYWCWDKCCTKNSCCGSRSQGSYCLVIPTHGGYVEMKVNMELVMWNIND